MKLWHIKAEEFCGDEHEEFVASKSMTIGIAMEVILERTNDTGLYREDINSIEFKEVKIVMHTSKTKYKIKLEQA